MPTFPHAPPNIPIAISGFTITAAVTEAPDTTLTVDLGFRMVVTNGAGFNHTLTGDLAQYLTPAQITNFTNAATALYTKAKAEVLA